MKKVITILIACCLLCSCLACKAKPTQTIVPAPQGPELVALNLSNHLNNPFTTSDTLYLTVETKGIVPESDVEVIIYSSEYEVRDLEDAEYYSRWIGVATKTVMSFEIFLPDYGFEAGDWNLVVFDASSFANTPLGSIFKFTINEVN